MTFAVVGLVLVGVTSSLNLVILLVLLRRRREQRSPGGGVGSGIRVGDPLPGFSARALDGTAVTERTLLGRESLVGFFSLTCRACLDAVPLFAAQAERVRSAGGISLAIVHGDHSATSEAAARLAAVVDIVIAEGADAELSKRFGARNYPSHAWYDPDGVVTTAGMGLTALRKDMVAP